MQLDAIGCILYAYRLLCAYRYFEVMHTISGGDCSRNAPGWDKNASDLRPPPNPETYRFWLKKFRVKGDVEDEKRTFLCAGQVKVR